MSKQPTAPYRFIPIEPGYVQTAPVPRKQIRFDRPLEGGSVSAVLEVRWVSETPVCIGTGKDTGIVEPLEIDGQYCLPGTSLRGMLRSTLEIATFSHLGRINSTHHHGVRNFSGIPGYHEYEPLSLKAGWLRFDDGKWKIYPARFKNHKFVRVSIKSVLAELSENSRPSIEEWRSDMDVLDKYKKLDRIYYTGLYSLGDNSKQKSFEVPCACLSPKPPGSKNFFINKAYPVKNVYIVCTGKWGNKEEQGSANSQDTENAKNSEALFPGPADDGFVIPDAWMQVFHGMHADYSRDGGNPRGSWRDWLRTFNWQDTLKGFESSDNDQEIPELMEKMPGIPVFWKGDLNNLSKTPPMPPGRQDNQSETSPMPPEQQSFWFSLSRVMRVPYPWSVGETAHRLYSSADEKKRSIYTPPRMEEESGWDFARALFGEIDGANIDRSDLGIERADDTNREDAQKGRVAIGFAWAAKGTKPEKEPLKGVFAQPRESFWPFYLRKKDVLETARQKGKSLQSTDETASYSNSESIPAGRKRTVVRSRENRHFPQGTDNTMSSIRFLKKGTEFTGRIRVHNLHPVEFGALLYALTFGDKNGKRWHQIGRAKGFGFGALSPHISFVRAPTLQYHKDDPLVQHGGKNPPPAPVADTGDISQWITLFQNWMSKEMSDRAESLGEYTEHPAIRMLEAMAEPATGDRLGGELETGELPDFAHWRKEITEKENKWGSVEYPLTNPLKN